MSVSNLTGTKWLINSTIVEPSSTIYADINFASNADNFSRIAIYDGFEPGSEQLIRYTLQEPESSIIVYEYGWSNEAYRTIEITGGTDVTNSTLIGWLEDNARQIVDDVAIKYQGNTIATMNASGTKTLLTAESYCENNITIEYTKPSANLQAKTGIVPQTTSVTVTPDSGYDGLSSVQINAMPSGSASTPATSITVTPSISVSSGGLITATASASQSVTPTVSAGYVSSGTAGTVAVSGSNTQQLTAQAAQTITPTTTNQTIASGKYLTGAQTILGDANLLAENIKKDVSIFGVTGTLESGGGGVQLYTSTDYSITNNEIEFVLPDGIQQSDLANLKAGIINNISLYIDGDPATISKLTFSGIEINDYFNLIGMGITDYGVPIWISGEFYSQHSIIISLYDLSQSAVIEITFVDSMDLII